VAFLSSAVCGCAMATFALGMSLYYGLNRSWYIYYGTGQEPQVILTVWSLLASLFGLGLALGVVIAVGMLLVFQIKSILKNQTGIEDWIREKADYRHRHSENKFIWPYNIGKMNNLKQVVGWSLKASGDGVYWQIVEGTDQFTLTREQLKQKEDKRERTREYLVTYPFSGAWFPLSHGLSVCCHPPCTDEPRIPLNVGSLVRVTRWKKYWLYGEKVQEEHKDRLRGWFPRHCAVERIDHEEGCKIAKQEDAKKNK